MFDTSYPSWWRDIQFDELETVEDCLELERLLSVPIAEMTRLNALEPLQARIDACEAARQARKRSERLRNQIRVRLEGAERNTVISLLERIAVALERLQP